MSVVIDEKCPVCGEIGLKLQGENGAVPVEEDVLCANCSAITTVTWAPAVPGAA